MSTPRLSFIDWMKVLGMLLIVLGHTGANELYLPTSPFNFKQLGVAFFVFVMGFSLAGEKRSPSLVVYNRVFEIWLFGWIFTLMMSLVTWYCAGDFAESNYLPLLLGINVAFNYFPANPTTWYIGTYFHLLLLWLLVLRHVQVRVWMVGLSLIAEIYIRALLIPAAGSLVAYMAMTNWISILLLGQWHGQQHQRTQEEAPKLGVPLVVQLAGLAALLAIWPAILSQTERREDFPFSQIAAAPAWMPWLSTSAAVSFLYFAYTCLAYGLTQRLPSSRWAEFLARNTLVVFIVHMPLIYWLSPKFYPFVPQGGWRVLANVTLFFLLPACLSELLRRIVRPVWWRDVLRDWWLARWRKPAAAECAT